jgi:hypothetical protein
LRIEDTNSKADLGLRKIGSIEKRVDPLDRRIDQITGDISAVTNVVSNLSEINAKAVEKIYAFDIDAIDAKVQEFDASQDKLVGINNKLSGIEQVQTILRNKVSELEEKLKTASIASESKSETSIPVMPVIPIKRDKAMAALTDTEVAVLEFLVNEGSKTAPEIKEKVKLSREHTARLMKKLYETGYLERQTEKLPFRYSVKKEMEKILKKSEAPSPQ